MKNKMVKIAFIILSVVFVFSACMTVFAVTIKSVTESQNGIEATLNFNKQEYNVNEEVAVTLNVKNNNSYAVKNIQTELIVPSTMKLSKGSLKQEAFSLNAGESKVQEVALEKVVETNNNEPTTNSPQTGDNVVVYIVMMVISAIALVVIAVKKKWTHKKKVMSLVLCFTLVGAMTLTSVVNAEPMAKEFTVEGTIKYDGEDVVIKGKVTYTHEIYRKLQIDGADKGMYVEGDTVTITAEDAPEGKHFAGWTVVKGNVTLADKNSKTTTFVMGTEEVEIKATFAINTYTITSTANAGGTITESTTVNYGDSKTFTITPNAHYHIENVEVDGVNKGKIDTYTFDNVKENHTIKATFAIDTFTIEVTSGENGKISPSSNVSVEYGKGQIFTVTANEGYHIDSIEIDGQKQHNLIGVGDIWKNETIRFTDVKENHKVKVTFAIDTFTITSIANEGGTITESATVDYGDSKTFTITPNAHYHIENVEVDGVNKGKIDTYTFNDVKEKHTIKATFAPNICTIRYLVNGTEYSLGDYFLNDGDSYGFFSPLAGYHIDSVEIDGVNKGKINEYIFTNVKESHTIDVTLAIDTFTITSTANAGGTITESATVDYGSGKTFTITPNTGYHIADVKVDGVSVGVKTSYEFTNVIETHTIEAAFAIDTFTITTKTNDGGSITGNTTVNYNDNAIFTITPNTGYGIVDVKVDGTSVGAKTSYEFKKCSKSHTIEVIFGVTTEETFKTAVNKGGYVYLANDINLGEPFYEDANVKIYGGDYKVSGSRLMFSSGDASIESGYFNEVGIVINEYYSHTGYLAINGGFFEKIFVDDIMVNDFTLEINAGTIKKIYGKHSNVSEYVSIKGGTFYFDPTSYVNTDTHKVTETTDANGEELWVVTEK